MLKGSQIEEFLDTLARCGNVAHEIAFRLPATTGLRVAELVCLKTLTRLTQAKLSTAQIKLLSGHSAQKSLEVYPHLALSDVEED